MYEPHYIIDDVLKSCSYYFINYKYLGNYYETKPAAQTTAQQLAAAIKAPVLTVL